MLIYFAAPSGGDRILAWRPKGLSRESIKYPTTSEKSLPQKLAFIVIVVKSGVLLNPPITNPPTTNQSTWNY